MDVQDGFLPKTSQTIYSFIQRAFCNIVISVGEPEHIQYQQYLRVSLHKKIVLVLDLMELH